MKGLALLFFILGISTFANAIAGQWMFDFSDHSGIKIFLDVVIGLGCWLASFVFCRLAESRSYY